MTRKVFFFWLLAISLLVPIPLASAAQDISPPTLAGLSFTPTSVDVSSSSEAVTVTAHVTDDLSGVRFATAFFKSPNGKQEVFANLGLASGSSTDGIFEGVATIPQYAQQGTWQLGPVRLSDNAKNEAILETSTLAGDGFPTALTITSPGDISPPTLAGLSFTPTSVDVSSSSEAVTVTAHVTDDLSGVRFATAFFKSPNGKQEVFANLGLASGSSTDGIFEGVATIPQYAQQGTWQLGPVRLSDNAKNEAILETSTLAGDGFPTALTITSPGDISPPTLAGLSFTPTSVDVSSSSEAVTVTAHVTDDLSGVRFATAFFKSPNGKQEVFANLGLASGSSTDGIFEGVATIPQYAQQGTWQLGPVRLSDNAKNEAILETSTLAGDGFPTALNVMPSQPSVSALHPDAGLEAGGTSVTITGSNLNGATKVMFGSAAATSVTENSATSLTATSPPGTNTVDVTVTTPGGTSATAAGDKFTYVSAGAPPTIKKLTPRKGAASGGISVTITGTALLHATVTFAGVDATITADSSTSVTAVTPPGTSGAAAVRVTTPNGASAESARATYKYAAPTVHSISPSTGPSFGGSRVIVTGTGFAPGAGLTGFKFGAAAATSVVCTSTTSCELTAPPHKAGVADVKATAGGLTSKKSAPGDQYTYN